MARTYKPTGKPRGRPRKNAVASVSHPSPADDDLDDLLGPPGDESVNELLANVDPPLAARMAPTHVVRSLDAMPEFQPPVRDKRVNNCGSQRTWWKPGQSGNPEGGRAHDPALKAVRKMTKEELAKIAQLVLDGGYDTLVELASDRSATVLSQMFASVCLRIINKGDMVAFDAFLSRIIGKVKDELDANLTHSAARVVVTLPANGREAKSA